jgi:hypothetical protein
MANETNSARATTTAPMVATAVPAPEALVSDTRAGLTPAQFVERKLVSLLKDGYLPYSHTLRGAAASRSRW